MVASTENEVWPSEICRNSISNLVYRNILTLTNHFDIAERNMTLENYDQWFDYLNLTHPGEISSLPLRVCDLQAFLDQVLLFSALLLFNHATHYDPLCCSLSCKRLNILFVHDEAFSPA